MSDNLADEFFGGPVESDAEEHDQNLICAIRLEGEWVSVIPGTLDLSFGEGGLPDVVFSVERADGKYEEGALSDITGLRSLDGQ